MVSLRPTVSTRTAVALCALVGCLLAVGALGAAFVYRAFHSVNWITEPYY